MVHNGFWFLTPISYPPEVEDDRWMVKTIHFWTYDVEEAYFKYPVDTCYCRVCNAIIAMNGFAT